VGRIDLIGALKQAWRLFLRDPLRLILLTLLGSVLSMTIILAPFMMAGCFEVLGKLARRETPEPEDLFRPLREFERYLVGGLIWLGAQLLGIVVGSAVPFLGTLIALAVNAFLLCYFPFMVFRRLDGVAAFGACRDLFGKEWPLLLVTAAILSVLSWLGMITLFLGFLVVVPYSLALIFAVYEQIHGLDDSGTVVEAETD
jgi:hypothetical protein